MSKGEKRPYDIVHKVASGIVDKLEPMCERIALAGSLRRGRPMIGDIEIVALPKPVLDLFGEPLKGKPTALEEFLNNAIGDNFIKNGSLYKQFPYGSYMVDLFLPYSRAHWGAVYQIRTGSHEFNMWVQTEVAPAADVRFGGGLVYERTTNKLIDTPEEKDVFTALQIPWIPPDARDDRRWHDLL